MFHIVADTETRFTPELRRECARGLEIEASVASILIWECDTAESFTGDGLYTMRPRLLGYPEIGTKIRIETL
jgi:hypothetical protein